METLAVVFERPEELSVRSLRLLPPSAADVVVRMRWSGISTGTERLLWTGRMPPFPGLGYPLVPGYEGVGEVIESGPESGRIPGDLVYVAGSRNFEGAHGLFGGQASHVVVPGARSVLLDAALGERGTLLALAATAQHALGDAARLARRELPLPDLIVGHGALGRLLARLTMHYAACHGDDRTPPTVWETNPTRAHGARGYAVVEPSQDPRRDYRQIIDASGADGVLDSLIERLAPGGEVCLAGFYSAPVSFAFPPAFLREMRLRIAAQWTPADLAAVAALANDGTLALDDLITHRVAARDAAAAYTVAFGDPECVKMILDWRDAA